MFYVMFYVEVTQYSHNLTTIYNDYKVLWLAKLAKQNIKYVNNSFLTLHWLAFVLQLYTLDDSLNEAMIL